MINITHLHPMLVHFPISLLFTSALFDLLSCIAKGKEFQKIGFYLLILGVISGIVASGSGLLIEEGIEKSGISEERIDGHKGFAIGSVAFFAFLLAIRISKRNNLSKNLFNLYLVLSLAGLVILSFAAYRGGNLVYEYGAAVKQLPAAGQRK